MQNVMVDLETLGTGANSVILSIGAVAFDPENASLGDEFKAVIDIGSSLAIGCKADGDTIAWWFKQPAAARKGAITNPEHIINVLNGFTAYLLKAGNNNLCDIKLWGNGSDFDNVILATAYKNARIEQPWKYYNNRCYRTLKSLYPNIMIARQGIYHNSLDDAISQAKHLINILKAMNI